MLQYMKHGFEGECHSLYFWLYQAIVCHRSHVFSNCTQQEFPRLVSLTTMEVGKPDKLYHNIMKHSLKCNFSSITERQTGLFEQLSLSGLINPSHTSSCCHLPTPPLHFITETTELTVHFYMFTSWICRSRSYRIQKWKTNHFYHIMYIPPAW